MLVSHRFLSLIFSKFLYQYYSTSSLSLINVEIEVEKAVIMRRSDLFIAAHDQAQLLGHLTREFRGSGFESRSGLSLQTLIY